MSLLSTPTLKIIIAFTLLIATFSFSMIPFIGQKLSKRRHLPSARRRRCKAVVSVLSCFAAGVFIGVCLLDLFPEVESKLHQVLSAAGVSTKFPLPEFVVVIGFLLLLFIEQFVLMWKEGMPTDTEYSPVFADCDSVSSSYNSIGPTRTTRPADYNSIGPTRIMRPGRLPTESPAVGFDNDDRMGTIVDSMAELDNVSADEEDEQEEENAQYTDPSSHSMMRSLILIIALSLHSLFEGLAVGLQPNADNTLRLFAALALHKCILAFSLGLNMVQSRLGARSVIFSNLLFSVASPLGIGLGLTITNAWKNTTAANATIGALQGIACGTFLYVVFFEILPHEFMKKRDKSYPNRMIKVLFLVVGFSVVVAVVFLDPDS